MRFHAQGGQSDVHVRSVIVEERTGSLQLRASTTPVLSRTITGDVIMRWVSRTAQLVGCRRLTLREFNVIKARMTFLSPYRSVDCESAGTSLPSATLLFCGLSSDPSQRSYLRSCSVPIGHLFLHSGNHESHPQVPWVDTNPMSRYRSRRRCIRQSCHATATNDPEELTLLYKGSYQGTLPGNPW